MAIILMLCWAFFVVNCIAWLLYVSLKRAKVYAAASIFILSIVFLWVWYGPWCSAVGQVDDLDVKRNNQRICKYNEDYYFINSNKPGVFMLTSSGSIKKIIESDTQVQKGVTKDPFCLKESTLYFTDRDAWKSFNLTTKEVSQPLPPESNIACGFTPEADMGKMLGTDIHILYSQISEDGWIYFSSDHGLYRTRPSSKDFSRVVAGQITIFDIDRDTVTYYTVGSKKVQTAKVPFQPQQATHVERKGADSPNSKVASGKSLKKETNQEKSERLRKEAMKYYRQEDYKKAREIWLEALKADPKNASTANNIAIAYRESKDYGNAIKWHKKAIALNPEYGHAWNNLGRTYAAKGDLDLAEQTFYTTLKKQYEPGPVHYNLGTTYGKKRDYIKAKEHFAKAINLGYRNYGTYESLSWACTMLGQSAEAEKAHAEAKKYDPFFRD
jgi:Tfp pilus assembly protein PilF